MGNKPYIRVMRALLLLVLVLSGCLVGSDEPVPTPETHSFGKPCEVDSPSDCTNTTCIGGTCGERCDTAEDGSCPLGTACFGGTPEGTCLWTCETEADCPEYAPTCAQNVCR